jgi:hypothetical protein
VSASGPPRRESPFWRRSPVFAVPALCACLWLLWDLWPDVAFFISTREPVDLGAPGAYRVERALPNRLVRVAGVPAAQVRASDRRGKEDRAVLGLRGVNLAVDRPAGAGPTLVYEGRLLPRSRAADYGEAVAALRARGWEAGDRWLVLRDGERPRSRWVPPILSLLLALVAAVNARALLRVLWS